MSNYKPDAGIPILTEVIEPVTDDDIVTAAPEAAVATPLPPQPVAEQISAAELQRIEHDITERVLQQILARIDFVLEQRVRDGFADVLQLAVERVAGELRSGLQQSLAEVVTRAVTQEISRLQSVRK